uniref:Cob(I)yrinic acid a,c-diamide adenosyltransferase n=1 Tax=candidate division WOR-3 bacterium TaxID=2052148 RepID=A0A7V3ZTW5_UNCW3
MIQIYTGNGKGKTTAAIGLGIRAIGHGYKVLMVQFMKGEEVYGEIKALKKIPNFDVYQFGLKTFVKKGDLKKEEIEIAKKGFEFAQEKIKSKEYFLVILDEINVAVDYGLIPLKDVIELIKNCPKEVELVLTGRYCPKELYDYADLVSEINEIKHPFQKGIFNRRGIDY